MAFASYREAVVAFRRYLNDIPQLNTLDREMESTDDELEDFIFTAMNNINMNYTPVTTYKLANIVVEPGEATAGVPWSIVRMGALLELLQIKGIISARNAITYSDAGGVTVAEMDKYGRYLTFLNVLAARYEKAVTTMKIRENITNAFGGVASPLGFDSYYG